MNIRQTPDFPSLGSLLISLSCATTSLAATVRVPHYEAALQEAKRLQADIVVYQHGSDWSRLGEYLLANVWNPPELEKALATNNVVLVAIDQPERPGNPPVSGATEPYARPTYTKPDKPSSILDAFAKTPAPPSEITAIESKGGATYARQEDGTFLASGENPAKETLTLTVVPSRPGSLLRLDFPTHPSLPAGGPGRAQNGNYAISEIEIEGPGPRQISIRSAWASMHQDSWGPWQAIDGVHTDENNMWNAYGHRHQPGLLLLSLDETIEAGTRLQIRLICNASWGHHTPGALRATLWDDAQVGEASRLVGQANARIAQNRKFTWRGDTTPRIALMDCEGRPVASEDKPRRGLTPASLAKRIAELQEIRKQRDTLWALAESQSGAEKAETLMKSLDRLGLGGYVGHEDRYLFVHKQIREADPQDTSGVQRWLQFHPDSRNAPEMVHAANKLVEEKKYAEAVALLDAEQNHPGNKHLTPDHLQRILLAKFNAVRQWPGHEEERFEIMRRIAALDPSTYLGLGATGYVAMHHKDPLPIALVYGWRGSQVKPGENRWDFLLGNHHSFDHPGRYHFRIFHDDGKDSLRIRRIALMNGGEILSEARPDQSLSPNGRVECILTLPENPSSTDLVVHLDAEAEEGKTDVSGRFAVDPLL